MPSPRLTARRLAASLLAAGSLGTSLLVLSCADQTGPGDPVPGRFSLAPQFESSVAGIVPLAHARFTLTRVPEGTVATDTVIDIVAGQDSLDVAIVVPLMHATETFSMRIALVTPAGDTVFRAGPLEVQPVATGPVPQVPITLVYTGVGANAMRVVCLYDSVAVFAGDATLLAAVVRDSSDNPIPGTPVGWRSLDSAVAAVPDPASGSVVGVAPGTARIVAELLTGQADTALVLVSLPPANVLADSGNGQTGTTGAQLPTPLVARVVASDGAGVPGQWVRFAVATGGGTLSADSMLTDSAGRARTLWTLGPVAGTQMVQATTPRLPGVTSPFTATSTAGTAGGMTIVAGDGQSGLVSAGLPVAPSVRVADAQDNPLPGIPVLFTVTAGGGSVTGGNQVTDANGIAAAGGWTLGAAVGINTITVTADTLTPVLFTATATGPGGAMSMVLNGGNGQTALAGTVLPLPVSVLVRDTANNVVAGVAVGFAATLGDGSVGDPAPLTNGSGIAAASWTLGTPGTNEVTASLAGLPDVVFQATGTVGAPDTVVIVSGNAQTDTAGLPLAQPLVVEVRDPVGNPVSGIAVNWNTFNGSISPPVNSTDLSGRAQAIWTLGTNAVNQSATASVSGLTPAVFTATAVFANPTVLLALAGTDRVRLTDSASLNVTLSAPAPVGGTVVTLSVDNPAVLGLDTTEVFIPESGTTTQTRVYGLSSGSTIIRGNASGYAAGAAPILVTVQVLSMPTTLNVPYGGTASLPLQISSPAPVGGVAVTVVSSDGTAVGVQSPTVTIPEGQQTANAILTGAAPGSATITASTTDFGVAQTSAATTANLNVIEGSAAFAQTKIDTLTVRLESSGAPIAAPSPGIPVTFTPRDPTCLAATSPATIPTGLVSVTTIISYGGSATTPCSTYLVAEAAGINADSLSVTVNPPPGMTTYAWTVGAGLQRNEYGYLGDANHGGVNVVIKTTVPGLVLLSPDGNSVGTDSIAVPVADGQTFFQYYVQALEGVADTGAATLTLTYEAPGFVTGTSNTTVRRPAFDVYGIPASTTTLSPSTAFYAYIGYTLPGYTYLVEQQPIRTGGQAVTVTFTHSTPGVGRFVTTSLTGDTVTVPIPVGGSNSPTSVATGGVAFEPVTAGSTTVNGDIPGYDQLTYYNRTVSVTSPGITMYEITVGAGLQKSTYGYLGASNHGGVNVVVKSSAPGVARLAPNDITVGDDSVVVFVPDGQIYFYYYAQGVEGQTGTVTTTARATGFTDGSAPLNIATPVVGLYGVPGTLSASADSVAFYAQVGVGYSANQYLLEAQNVRAGGIPLTVTFTHSAAAVADLINQGGRGDVVTVTIPIGTYYSPTSVLQGGAAIKGTAPGSTVVSGSAPGFITLLYDGQRAVTVTP